MPGKLTVSWLVVLCRSSSLNFFKFYFLRNSFLVIPKPMQQKNLKKLFSTLAAFFGVGVFLFIAIFEIILNLFTTITANLEIKLTDPHYD